jgi:signal peptidase I
MDEPTPAPPRRVRGCLIEVLETVILTAVIFLGVQTFVAQPYEVNLHSMDDTLLPGHYVLVDKLTPRWAPYERGDIVVFQPPETAPGEAVVPFIKRVIGLPGETVELRNGKVFVDGVELDEPYIFEESGVPQPTDPTDGETEWVIPDGRLFVMGDHRRNSSDSRSFGPIEISGVIGRAWLRYWPFDRFGPLPTPAY